MSDELLEGIKTKAGQELITYMNQNYGSSVWGKVRDAVEAIEKELCKHENTSWDEIKEALTNHKREYQEYRGSSFDEDGTVLWMKDDVAAYCEAIDNVLEFIQQREPKKVERKK